MKAEERPRQQRFAGAGFADDAEHFALIDGEADAGDHAASVMAKRDRDIFDLEKRLIHRS